MKIAIGLLFSIGVLSLASGQEMAPASDGVVPSIGLGVGEQTPPFALTDQFGHEQSDDSLKGSKGTVILFFRSADW